MNDYNRPGKDSDYSKIVKWIQRGGYLTGIVPIFGECNDENVIVIYY